MLIILLSVCLLPWIAILLYQIASRRFTVLVLWLLIAPVVTNLAEGMGNTTLYETSGSRDRNYDTGTAKITLYKLLKPTRILFSIFLVFFLLERLGKKRPTVPLDRTEIWMSILSVILIASVFLQSKRLAFGLHVAIDAFIVPFLAYYLTRRLVTNEDRFRQVIAVIGYMGFYVIPICLQESLLHRGGYVDRWTREFEYHRVAGLFERRDHLYIAMLVVFCAVLSDFLGRKGLPHEKGALPRSIAWLVMLLTPVVIFLTYTRGNWGGFMMGLGIMLFLGRRMLKFPSKVGAIGLALVFLPVIVIGAQSLASKELYEGRVTNWGNLFARVATWKVALEEAGEAPIFGIGLNNLNSTLQREKTLFKGSGSVTTPHNAFVAILVDLGAVGLFLHLAIPAAIFQIGLRLYRRGSCFKDRWRGIAVIAVILAYHMPSLFEHLVYQPTVAHVYVYAFVGSVAGLYNNTLAAPQLYPSASEPRIMSAPPSPIPT